MREAGPTTRLAVRADSQMEAPQALVIEGILKAERAQPRVKAHACAISIATPWFPPNSCRVPQNSLAALQIRAIVSKDGALQQHEDC